MRYFKYERRLYYFVRYGQDTIETLLRSKGAAEAVDIPKKISVVGETVDPPWVRKTSRRDPATA